MNRAPDYKREGMGENSQDYLAELVGDETFAVSEEEIKASLNIGIDELFPPETVRSHINEVHAGLISAESVVTGATVSFIVKNIGGKIIVFATSVMVVAALGVGIYGLTTAGLPGESAPTGTETITQKTIQYAGEPHIRFTAIDGSDSPYGVQSIVIEDVAETPETITWEITTPEGKQLIYGEGAEITLSSGLGTLAPGEYKVNFVLTDKQGATALSYRSFTIR